MSLSWVGEDLNFLFMSISIPVPNHMLNSAFDVYHYKIIYPTFLLKAWYGVLDQEECHAR